MTDLDPRWADAIRAHARDTAPTPEAWAAITERAEQPAADATGTGPPRRRSWVMAAAATLVVVLGVAAVVATRAGEDEGVRTDRATTVPLRRVELPARVEGLATVLESDAHGPEACFGAIAESYPPQCSGLPLVGWDWAAVEGEEAAVGTTWGLYHVVGDYDGETLTVVGTPQHDPTGETGDPFEAPDTTPPCDPPAGGWDSVDGAPNGEAARGDLTRVARAAPDFAGIWMWGRHGPGERDVFTVAFTGDLARHRAELEEVWGGPLCVIERDHTLAALQEAAGRVAGGAMTVGGIDLDVVDTQVDEVAGRVEVRMTYAPEGAEEALEEELGVPVRVDAPLRPA